MDVEDEGGLEADREATEASEEEEEAGAKAEEAADERRASVQHVDFLPRRYQPLSGLYWGNYGPSINILESCTSLCHMASLDGTDCACVAHVRHC